MDWLQLLRPQAWCLAWQWLLALGPLLCLLLWLLCWGSCLFVSHLVEFVRMWYVDQMAAVSAERQPSATLTRSLFSTVEARGIHRGRGASPVYPVGDQPTGGMAASEAAHQLTRHVVWTPGQPLLTLCSVFLLFSLLTLLTPRSLTLWPVLVCVVPSLGEIAAWEPGCGQLMGRADLPFPDPASSPVGPPTLPTSALLSR